MILSDIIQLIESVAPLTRQEAWDNSGLQVGQRDMPVESVLLTTDVTLSVVQEAIDRHCQLIVSHHPLLYHGLKHIVGDTEQERCVMAAIEHHIAIYSAHTSMDNYIHGVSGEMAQRIGLNNYRVLVPQDDSQYGLGVIGRYDKPIVFEHLLQRLKTAFSAEWLRYIPPVKDEVQTIALCGGAGSEFMEQAIHQGADVFVSADFKYHAMQPAVGRIGIVDMDHWVSEHFTRDVFHRLLEGQVSTCIAQTDHSPVHYY